MVSGVRGARAGEGPNASAKCERPRPQGVKDSNELIDLIKGRSIEKLRTALVMIGLSAAPR